MSEPSDNKENNQITWIDVIIVAVGVLVSIPVLPLNIAYIFLMLRTNRKENFILYPCLILILMMCSKFGLFLSETARITTTIIKGFANSKFLITAYGIYSFTSWVLLVAVSFVVASYAVKRIRYNRKLEDAGVTTLKREHRKNGGALKCYEHSY